MKLLLLALMPALAVAAPVTDYLYVYHPTGNVHYACHKLPSYLTTEDNSRLEFSQCEVLVIDYQEHAYYPSLPVRLTLSGPAFKAPNVRHCSFVAQANGPVDTSTVADCR